MLPHFLVILMNPENSIISKAISPHFINPAGLHDPRPNAYSHIAIVEAPARVIYFAGQGGETEDGELSPDFDKQVHQALHNLRIALDAATIGVDKIVKLTVLIVDHSEDKLAVVARQLKQMWGEHPGPACTLIPVPRLALDKMLFEIDATAITRS